MKIVCHDAFRTFDYTEFVNRVYDKMIDAGLEPDTMALDLKCSVNLLYKLFNYKVVSLPTLVVLANYASLNLIDFVIWQD